jgi:hypothetical protein
MSGRHGVTVIMPSAMRVETETAHFARLLDAAHQVSWHVTIWPTVVDLDDAHDDLLRADLTREARADFDRETGRINEERGHVPVRRRTDDASWTPVVSMERTTLGGAPAFIVIRRATDQPMHELVVCDVIVPLEQGTLGLTGATLSTGTGLRESTLFAEMMLAGNETPPPQSTFDDPALDARFPDHVLSRTRASLRFLREKAQIRVMRPYVR